MSSTYDFDLAVIGSGPGGYVSAIRAAQLGLKTVIIEKDKPGGVCLNVGCIPSKSLIHQTEIFENTDFLKEIGVDIDKSGLNYSLVKKKSRIVAERLSKGVQYLINKNNIKYISGNAVITGPNNLIIDDAEKISSRNILIASGSRPKEIPEFSFDHDKVITSTDALLLDKLPETLLILGAGVIGMEFAYIASSFGCKVTIVEMLPKVLPNEEPEISELVYKAFKKRGVTIHTGTKALGMNKNLSGVTLEIEKEDGSRENLEGNMLLVAVGRTPNSESIGLESVGIRTERGFIPAGDYYQTSVPGIYAVGDVINTPLLAHAASGEGEIAVTHMAGIECKKRLKADEIPQAVYCNPQVGSFGLTEEKVKSLGLEYKTASFPFRGVGKAVAVDQPDGFIKLISSNDDQILGCHIAGAEATELIHELLLAKINKIPAFRIAEMVHAHPTLSEGIMEASRALSGRAIHI